MEIDLASVIFQIFLKYLVLSNRLSNFKCMQIWKTLPITHKTCFPPKFARKLTPLSTPQGGARHSDARPEPSVYTEQSNSGNKFSFSVFSDRLKNLSESNIALVAGPGPEHENKVASV